MIRAAAALALMGALAWPGAAQEAVDPVRPGDGLLPFKDSRVIVDATRWPWSAIGRLNIARRGHCTAVLVADRLLLTAAHCLFDRRTGRWVAVEDLHFLAGYQRGAFLHHVRAATYEADPGYDPTAGPAPANVRHDWALIRLKGPAGRPLPLRRFTPAEAQQPLMFAQAGYHKTRPHVITLTPRCAPDRPRAEGLIFHSCWIAQGDSGSPLLIQEGEAYALVALNSTMVRQGETIGGIALPSSRFWAKVQRLAED